MNPAARVCSCCAPRNDACATKDWMDPTKSEVAPYTLNHTEISVSFLRSLWLAWLRSSAIAMLALYGPGFAQTGEDPSFLCLKA